MVVVAPRRPGTLIHVRPTVLIVDDHPAFRSLARALLESEGFEVVGEAEDGAAAIAAVAVSYTHLTLPTIYSV